MYFRKTMWVFIALLLFLTSCTSSGNSGTVQSGTPQLRPSPVITPSLTPIEPTIGPVPHNCPVSTPTRHTISPNYGSVIGSTPVWAGWPLGANIYHAVLPNHPSSYEAPYGWDMMKVIWEVGPHYNDSATIRGHDIFDQTPLMIEFLNDTPTIDTVLDPHHPDHPVSVVGDGWAEWGSYIVIPKAGCYSMEVSWPTGHWSVIFAVGA
ncbi:MAG: hypothetical protein M3Z24_03555 [Chloroflexota bacterium]|nr:hypothetical protein [Chloroflexota bacterium]